jgi:hypothetical protein
MTDRVLADKQIDALKGIGGVEYDIGKYTEKWLFGKENQWEIWFVNDCKIAFPNEPILPRYVLYGIVDALRIE